MHPFTFIYLVEMTGKYLTVLRYTYQFQAPVKGKGGMTGQRPHLEVSLYMLHIYQVEYFTYDQGGGHNLREMFLFGLEQPHLRSWRSMW